MWLTVLLGLPVLSYILLRALRLYWTWEEGYWPKKGVPFVPSAETAPWKVLLGKKAMHAVDKYYYDKFPKARFVGYMEMRKPAVLLRDPDLVKQVCVKDFDSFSNRREIDFGSDFADGFLFTMAGSAWKDLRAAVSPTFTSGKIRKMFPHFEKSANDMVNFVERKRDAHGEVQADTREIFGRLTMDVIGSTAFGIDSQCLTDDSSLFYKMGNDMQAQGLVQGIKLFITFVLPKVQRLLKIEFLPKVPLDFFRSICNRALQARRTELEKGGSAHHSDFLQLMVETQKRRAGEGGEQEKEKENEVEDEMNVFERDAELKSHQPVDPSRLITDKIVVANGLTFFFAGFDNTEAQLTVAAYHLAIYPEMQKRLRDEVDQVVQEFDGKITYDGVAKMKYLDMFVSECLRLYPPAVRAERKVTKPYRIPGTDITLEVNTPVAMPIYAFHRDEQHFPKPNEFNPEHFNEENKAKRHPYAYMPFGHGPRSCIAMRFVITEIRASVAHLVHNFEIQTCAETTIPFKLKETMGLHRPAEGLKLALVRRQ